MTKCKLDCGVGFEHTHPDGDKGHLVAIKEVKTESVKIKRAIDHQEEAEKEVPEFEGQQQTNYAFMNNLDDLAAELEKALARIGELEARCCDIEDDLKE